MTKFRVVEQSGAKPETETRFLGVLWAIFVVAAILLLPIGNGILYGLIVSIGALLLAVVSALVINGPGLTWKAARFDNRDLIAIAGIYIVVVALFKLAFGVFGTGQVAGLFLSFGAAMLVGVIAPVVYTVWIRQRPLASLGIGFQQLPATLGLAVVFAVAQFAVTLLGLHFPEPVDWVPLLAMALTVGIFEAIFFRGFIQGTLERSVGVAPSVAIAAALYGLYHFGYGMEPSQMWFLFGLGIVYTVAYRVTNNVLAIWPLLTPLGSFFVQIRSGELSGQLPWISILGFVDIAAVMVVIILLALRHEHRSAGSARAKSLRPAAIGGGL